MEAKRNMMLCEMLLSAGLVAAAACDQPKENAAGASVTLVPPVMAGESHLEGAPETLSTGMTLADVAFNAKWRKATFDGLVYDEE
jgi:hypothetical protein